jgi:hypothetical protein
MAPARRWSACCAPEAPTATLLPVTSELLDAALAGLPAVDESTEVGVRGDAGYAFTDFLAHAVWRGCRFSVGFEITEAIKTAIRAVVESAWQPAVTPDGNQRDRAHVVELTDAIALPHGGPRGRG